ncbi:hypothetical protein BJV85_003461 [Clostridium acetobutylicum]|nr:hypothetical protein [Clostridium acetobutylicum]NOW16114.1 hypothetical protein [Clostridium acetobutylicum]NRY57794.1 hypothetical protein [Clostridium acetobutylicum]NSA94538.1 hypothetical protein [Clostridium acetobutylicum]NYC95700.1 hypothetical protein [Clostridium acetobutylicum]
MAILDNAADDNNTSGITTSGTVQLDYLNG